MKDVWETFLLVLDERKQREVDPTLSVLRQCVAQAEQDTETDEYTEQRLRELTDFFGATTAWYSQLRSWSTASLVKFVKLGDKAARVAGLAGR